MIIELSAPIKAHGEERHQIEMREPKGGDIAACGLPFRIYITEDGGQQSVTDTVVVSGYISRLGNIPKGAVEQLSVQDWMACSNGVFSFFGQGQTETSSTDTSTSPGSGSGRQKLRSI